MKFIYFIGCDVSKNELDFAVYNGNKFVLHRKIKNDTKSINNFFIELQKLPDFELSNTIVCMEHTGIYNNPLLEYLHKMDGNICLESALQIKNSQGSVRGKNDKEDSYRITLFTEIMKDSALKETSIISLGSRDLEFTGQAGFGNSWAEWYECFIPEDYKHNKQLGLDFLNNYDSSIDTFVDSNLEYNLAFNFNETLHLNTFVNVLTETLFENETIFLSEKIFKPIKHGQMFFVAGGVGSLQTLRDLGYRVFDHVLDNSYDLEPDHTQRWIQLTNSITKAQQQGMAQLFEQCREDLIHNQQLFSHNKASRLNTLLERLQ